MRSGELKVIREITERIGKLRPYALLNRIQTILARLKENINEAMKKFDH